MSLAFGKHRRQDGTASAANDVVVVIVVVMTGRASEAAGCGRHSADRGQSSAGRHSGMRVVDVGDAGQVQALE